MTTPRTAVAAAFALVATAFLAAACATTHPETREQCIAKCNAMYENCSERSLGGDTLNRCGENAHACHALCPSH